MEAVTVFETVCRVTLSLHPKTTTAVTMSSMLFYISTSWRDLPDNRIVSGKGTRILTKGLIRPQSVSVFLKTHGPVREPYCLRGPCDSTDGAPDVGHRVSLDSVKTGVVSEPLDRRVGGTLSRLQSLYFNFSVFHRKVFRILDTLINWSFSDPNDNSSFLLKRPYICHEKWVMGVGLHCS